MPNFTTSTVNQITSTFIVGSVPADGLAPFYMMA